jgi:hypothetical protein
MFDQQGDETMKKTKMIKALATAAAVVKAPRATYLLRHPLKGTRNLLMLRGARSLLGTRKAALTAAAAVAVPVTTWLLVRDGSD